MATTVDIAVVGAGSLVGAAMLELLAEREFPLERLYLLGDESNVGDKLEYKDRYLPVEAVAGFDFSKVQLALFAGGAASREQIEAAAAAGCIAIDHGAGFIGESDVPAVVAEVNPERLADHVERGIVVSPAGMTVLLATALKPIADAVGIDRVNLSTYQAVSGLGKAAVEELAGQTARLLNAQSIKTAVFPRQIAFNLLPQVGALLDDGQSEQEARLSRELRKVLGDDALGVNVTAVWVPVFYGDAAAVNLELKRPLSAEAARRLLEGAPGIALADAAAGEYPTPVTDAAQRDEVFVGRIRSDISHPRGLNIWVVADNVRKGAALNGVQLAELLVRDYL